MSKQLSLEWTKGVPDERKASFVEVIRNSTIALNRLYEITEEWEEELNRQEIKLDDFAGPNWAQKQAFRNGDRSRIRKLRELLSFLKGDIT
jgi:hypothetical protein